MCINISGNTGFQESHTSALPKRKNESISLDSTETQNPSYCSRFSIQKFARSPPRGSALDFQIISKMLQRPPEYPLQRCCSDRDAGSCFPFHPPFVSINHRRDGALQEWAGARAPTVTLRAPVPATLSPFLLPPVRPPLPSSASTGVSPARNFSTFKCLFMWLDRFASIPLSLSRSRPQRFRRLSLCLRFATSPQPAAFFFHSGSRHPRCNAPLLLGPRRNYRVLRFASGLPRCYSAYRWSTLHGRGPGYAFLSLTPSLRRTCWSLFQRHI